MEGGGRLGFGIMSRTTNRKVKMRVGRSAVTIGDHFACNPTPNIFPFKTLQSRDDDSHSFIRLPHVKRDLTTSVHCHTLLNTRSEHGHATLLCLFPHGPARSGSEGVPACHIPIYRHMSIREHLPPRRRIQSWPRTVMLNTGTAFSIASCNCT